MIEPGDHVVRVRSLQNHDLQVQSIHRGQRAAMNITGIDHHQIVRGRANRGTESFVRKPNDDRPIAIAFDLASAAQRSRAAVRFHLGTADLVANIRLLDRDKLEPGEHCLAQAFLNEPAVASNQQAYVIRAESPAATIGGGRILDPDAQRLPRPSELDLTLLRDLAGDNEDQRTRGVGLFQPLGQWKRELALA